MNVESLIDSELFAWVLLPLIIFIARVVDVSMGTLRIVFVSKGLKYLAPIIGFFEVIIWLLAIRVIMQNLNNFMCYFAYGAGFAMGNYVGIFLEKRLAVGRAVLRVITHRDASDLIKKLREKGYGVTSIVAQGSNGNVNVLFMVIKRGDFTTIANLIREFNPKAFYTLEDVKFVSEGIFPTKKGGLKRDFHFPLFLFWRKGK
jgi:uncharacterized protein YebE (UPF0316 family)